MNEDCWLGINGIKPQYSGQNYINALTGYVNMFTSQGFVVILDLHWTAPGSQQATKQLPMPDRDHTIDFWKSVASHFSGNDKVIFELFNEPFPDNGSWNSDEGWKCWRDGGSCNGVNYQVFIHTAQHCLENKLGQISVFSKSREKAYWKGGVWVEPYTTSKLFPRSISTSKKKKKKNRHIGPIPLKYTGENTGSNVGLVALLSRLWHQY